MKHKLIFISAYGSTAYCDSCDFVNQDETLTQEQVREAHTKKHRLEAIKLHFMNKHAFQSDKDYNKYLNE